MVRVAGYRQRTERARRREKKGGGGGGQRAKRPQPWDKCKEMVWPAASSPCCSISFWTVSAKRWSSAPNHLLAGSVPAVGRRFPFFLSCFYICLKSLLFTLSHRTNSFTQSVNPFIQLALFSPTSFHHPEERVVHPQEPLPQRLGPLKECLLLQLVRPSSLFRLDGNGRGGVREEGRIGGQGGQVVGGRPHVHHAAGHGQLQRLGHEVGRRVRAQLDGPLEQVLRGWVGWGGWVGELMVWVGGWVGVRTHSFALSLFHQWMGEWGKGTRFLSCSFPPPYLPCCCAGTPAARVGVAPSAFPCPSPPRKRSGALRPRQRSERRQSACTKSAAPPRSG